MPPKTLPQSETNPHLPVAHDWKQTFINHVSDKTRIFNTFVLMYAFVVSPLIIFSQATKSELEWKPFKLEMIGLDTTLPGSYILFLLTLLVLIGIIHANQILQIIYSYFREKTKQ